MLDLFCVEALAVVLLHATTSVDGLHKTNHRLVALRIEVDVVAGSDSCKATCTIRKWVITNGLLDVIAEITNEPLTIAELNSEGLIINGTPCTVNCFTVALALFGTLLSSGFVPIE